MYVCMYFFKIFFKKPVNTFYVCKLIPAYDVYDMFFFLLKFYVFAGLKEACTIPCIEKQPSAYFAHSVFKTRVFNALSFSALTL